MIVNEDNRRRLTAFQDGKLLEIKEDCIVGKHYHKIKTEYFVLCSGLAEIKKIKDYQTTWKQINIGEIVIVEPFVYHEFYIKKGSILIGLCTHPYDPKDDYHL